MQESYLKTILEVIEETIKEQGLPVPEISPDTDILSDTGLDSISLSVVLVKLEERTHKDPFVSGFRRFRTVKDLAAIYES